MRKLIFFSAIALWIFAATGCDKEEVELKDHISVSNLSHAGCKNNTQKSTKKEYIRLKAKGKYLGIEHINADFNCCPGKIFAGSKISNDTIFINEDETEHACDCVCKYDLTYELGILVYRKYHIIFRQFNWTVAEFNLDFNSKTNKIIYITHKDDTL